MLDENLPAFFLKPSSNGIKHEHNIFLSYHGSDAAPAYLLHHAAPAHKNCYAAALVDAYYPDVLFGEVLCRPAWTQPTLSQEELCRNNDFLIQLYNPDQQVRVELKEGTWGANPASLAITPNVHFAWRKESKLGKDLTCFMTGKSTDVADKKSKNRKDPDIAIALWRNMRELTIYEPNLQRLDMEDPKGLEVVLLLSAIVIKDLYFSSKEHMRELFNILEMPHERKLSGGGKKLSNPNQTHSIAGAPNPLSSHPPTQATSAESKRNSLPRLQTQPTTQASTQPSRPHQRQQSNVPPPADPRTQWEIEAETARLKAQAEAEAKEARKKQAEIDKETERLRKLVEEENRAARKKQAEIDKETERLRKKYGVQPIPQRPNTSSSYHRPHASTGGAPYMQPIPQGTQVNLLSPPQQPPRPQLGSNGLYVQPSASSSAVVMSGGVPSASSSNLLAVPGGAKKKKSFFGLRSASDDGADPQRLRKKSSAMW